jgi:hypothetical protein
LATGFVFLALRLVVLALGLLTGLGGEGFDKDFDEDFDEDFEELWSGMERERQKKTHGF